MLIVIADDLTGAAELAGIGLMYGLTVELAIGRGNPQSRAELLVIATDTRSVSEREAVNEVTEVCRGLLPMKPALLYKKVDSVLRGHVVAETLAQLAVLGLSKALIVSANPALGRTLVGGQYYIHGQLIHQTSFAHDPEFPITESDVQKRLSRPAAPVFVRKPTDVLPDEGIVIGEAGGLADLQAWADRIDAQTLLGGGSGFFTAILEAGQRKKQQRGIVNLGQRQLFVSGTSFGDSVALVKKAVERDHAVHYMPKSLMDPYGKEASKLTDWANATADSLHQQNRAIIAIEPDASASKDAVHLRTIMAAVVSEIQAQVPLDELIIEGGSTASAVLRALGVTRLLPTQELAPGVVRSRAVGHGPLHITVKPGSYRWHPDLWKF